MRRDEMVWRFAAERVGAPIVMTLSGGKQGRMTKNWSTHLVGLSIELSALAFGEAKGPLAGLSCRPPAALLQATLPAQRPWSQSPWQT